ncbi:MAG: cohesin domain-containing protein [Acidobacteriota bacterium]|nr:cohesin domain-containing protein [Acidobacteriota bacterium]
MTSAKAQLPSPVQLDLGMDVAGPGQHVFVPVTFSKSESTVVRLVFKASFSREKLLYSETLPGEAVKTADVEIKADITDPTKGGDQIELQVEISSDQGLPPGELLRISFQISENAELNEDIIVKNSFLSVETVDGEDLQVVGSDGIIAIIANAFFACLFYMH